MKKILALALSAGILGAMSMSPANAAAAFAPSAVKAAATQQAGGVELVQRRDARDRRRARNRGYNRGYRQGYRAGNRYRSAPRGWRRYGSRPSYWRTRGCVIVGPVWFCP